MLDEYRLQVSRPAPIVDQQPGAASDGLVWENVTGWTTKEQAATDYLAVVRIASEESQDATQTLLGEFSP